MALKCNGIAAARLYHLDHGKAAACDAELESEATQTGRYHTFPHTAAKEQKRRLYSLFSDGTMMYTKLDLLMRIQAAAHAKHSHNQPMQSQGTVTQVCATPG